MANQEFSDHNSLENKVENLLSDREKRDLQNKAKDMDVKKLMRIFSGLDADTVKNSLKNLDYYNKLSLLLQHFLNINKW